MSFPDSNVSIAAARRGIVRLAAATIILPWLWACGDTVGTPVVREPLGPPGPTVLVWPGTECVGTSEICGNHFDEDCDGVADNGCAADCSTCSGASGDTWVDAGPHATRVDWGHRELKHAYNDRDGEMGVLFGEMDSERSRFFRVDLSGRRLSADEPMDFVDGFVSDMAFTGSGYVVLYSAELTTGGSLAVWGQRLLPDGSANGSRVRVAGDVASVALGARVLRIGDTLFITWVGCPATSAARGCADESDVYLQRFDSALTPNGPEIRLTDTSLTDGSFANGAIMTYSPMGLGVFHERPLDTASAGVFSLVRDDRLVAQQELVIHASSASNLREIALAYGDDHFLACGTNSAGDWARWCQWLSSTGSLMGERFAIAGSVPIGIIRVDLVWTGCRFALSTQEGFTQVLHRVYFMEPGAMPGPSPGLGWPMGEVAFGHSWLTPLTGGDLVHMHHGTSRDFEDTLYTLPMSCSGGR